MLKVVYAKIARTRETVGKRPPEWFEFLCSFIAAEKPVKGKKNGKLYRRG